MMRGGADIIHLDVMDGQFVPPITFGADLAKSLSRQGDTPIEAHLMTLTPQAHFRAFTDAGCTRIIFHIETVAHAHRYCQQLREMGVEAGVAINPSTPASALEPLLDVMDLALVMTVNPGWGGQKLIGTCVDKVRAIRAMAPDLAIQVDGGIDPSTIGPVWDAGATDFVAGSYLMRAPSISEGIQELKSACGSKSL
jgi:ribulose-phosphate 3-epimerase